MGPLPPPPVLELTVEQFFKLRRIEDLCQELDKKEIINHFLQVQKQNFILNNTVRNLLQHWNATPLITPEDP